MASTNNSSVASSSNNAAVVVVDDSTITTAASSSSSSTSAVLPNRAVRLTAGRVEKLVSSLERIAAILSSLGAETREVNKAIKLLLKPSAPASQQRKNNPSAYNIFIKAKMPTVRQEHPEASAKERMQICAALWKQEKTTVVEVAAAAATAAN